MPNKRLTILSGPACVGKGPLLAALNRFHSEIRYGEVPVIKSKESRGDKPRPDELDKWDDPSYFRTAEEIKKLGGSPQFLVGDCRGFPQAVDLQKVDSADTEIILIEIYHTIGRQLRVSKYLKSVEVNAVFLSPIGQQEIALLRACNVCLTGYLQGLMAHKQLMRAQFQRKMIDRALLADIQARAADAIDELRSAPDYGCVIVNRDGEGSENWNRRQSGEFSGEPRGDAKVSLDVLVDIIRGNKPQSVEHWRHGVV